MFSFCLSEVLFLFVGWEPSFSFGVSPGGSVGCCCCGATLWTNKDKQGQTIAYLTRLCIVLLDQLHPSVSVSVSVSEPVSGSTPSTLTYSNTNHRPVEGAAESLPTQKR